LASEQNSVSNVLIAQSLAQGDFSLTAGLLSTFSVIHALTHWGSEQIETDYLSAFTEDPQLKATFAVHEATAAFNQYHLKTTATPHHDHYLINGQKTLFILGESADLYQVGASLNGTAKALVVQRNQTITAQKSPAMGLKATQTVSLKFANTPAQRLGDENFHYTAFVDLGNLMWCAMAVGTCEAVKKYCIQYANERTAFGEPI